MKTKLKLPGTKRLKLKCDILLSTSAFKFKLRRYTTGEALEMKENPAIQREPDGGYHVRPFFSIVMAAYNQGKFIDDTVKSVLGQSYERWGLADVAPHVNKRILNPHLYKDKWCRTTRRVISARP